MRLKVYQAPNIGAAMAMVRTDLGPDALIVATRQADGGVEVTAALEAAAAPVLPLPDPAREASLRWHGVPAPLATTLGRGELTQTLQATFRYEKLALDPGAPPLLLTGPPGAGKTLTLAKLATRLVLAGTLPLVITADARRAGAAEQLAAFTRLLGLTLIAADEPLPLARALARRSEGAPVLIDTPGLNLAEDADRLILLELLAASGGRAALVLPAGLDPAEARELADSHRELGATALIATRLDQSRRLGGILAAASSGLALCEAGIGAGVADGLAALTPAFLADRLEPSPGRSAPEPARPKPAPPLPPYIRPREGHPRRPQ